MAFEIDPNELYKYKPKAGNLPVTHGYYHLTLLESDFKYFVTNNERADWTHIMSVVAFNMRLFRLAYDYSIKDLCILMGSVYAYYTGNYEKKENGLKYPHVNDIYILSSIYGLDPEEFFVDRIERSGIELEYEEFNLYREGCEPKE